MRISIEQSVFLSVVCFAASYLFYKYAGPSFAKYAFAFAFVGVYLLGYGFISRYIDNPLNQGRVQLEHVLKISNKGVVKRAAESVLNITGQKTGKDGRLSFRYRTKLNNLEKIPDILDMQRHKFNDVRVISSPGRRYRDEAYKVYLEGTGVINKTRKSFSVTAYFIEAGGLMYLDDIVDKTRKKDGKR